MKQLPYLSRKEKQVILDCCTRSADGCLLYVAPEGMAYNLTRVRGELYSVTRLLWAEEYAWKPAAADALEVSEVIHIAECPNTGDHRNGQVVPLCVEPSHLILGNRAEAIKQSKQRLIVYAGRTA